MTIATRRAVLGLLATASLAAATSGAHAQGPNDWPNRPVKIIVAYPAGQSTDIATRYFADKLSRVFGQGFVVDNKPGAGGNIGTAIAARATPDGYTLVMGANGTHAMNPALYTNVGYDAEKDFDAIVLTALIPFAISVGPNVPVNSLNELIVLARSKPGKVDAAFPSVTGQLVLEMLKQRDVPLFGIRFKGSADAMTATLGGHVPVLIDTVAATRVGLGKIKPLAVTTATPMASMPGVKTASEQSLPNFTLTAWNALMVPRGVPMEIQNKLATEMRKILDLPETQKALGELGFERAPIRTTAELNAWLREERRTYAEVIKTANMKPE
ncbi:tripartite tricarboxylate transporter substrate binding protein [Rhodoferax sp.]|uniref:Bug family tripartite tricarboxylate transporter substrate binding protein n=1 Tax=Rhodoferax sp. TaxID=50421 RepID=UPI0027191029|nr:tripartite tricarboxylate transporter substrate binding protein [Rhodoferax sp.]MDO9197255.1 tripartite tricarboxylate transporter substrate binding protein [Rhodoferax sp.]